MELREFFKFLKRNCRLILAVGVVFLALGLGLAFCWPEQFEATGYLFVDREAEVPEAPAAPTDNFTYEGYYAQQTAQSYTPTVIAFLESGDVLKLVLDETGVSPSEAILRLRQAGPQLIEVRIQHSDAGAVARFWEGLVGAGLERWTELAGTITVEPVAATPLVTRQELPLLLSGVVSLLAGLLLGGLVAAGKEYLG